MKTFLKVSAITLPLLFTMPAFAQVSWGVDLHFGTPPPRHEVIVARPYADAEWVPGYYNYYTGHRYAWVQGFWRRPEQVEHREYREHDVHDRIADRGHDADHDRSNSHGRNNSDLHRGRIR